jgi:intracellular sulfur oxidation DsrE/DsrF family protein
LIGALTDAGVRIILCGQTAAYRDISKDDLLPNVELALSAMTAHAQLQQSGYTLNPF